MRWVLLLAIVWAAGCGAAEPSGTAEQPEPVVQRDEPVEPPSAEPEMPAKSFKDQRIHPLSELARAEIRAAGKPLKVWVADTAIKRQEGMMWLEDKDVPQNEGMLFVFSYEQPLSFWMSNTLIALDIIYIDESGKVVSIAQGEPKSEESLPAKAPAMYVLEMKKGSAQRLGIKPGSKIDIPADLTAKD
ncbi:MAG TPA: DUF192 domain-containing protein [Fimbriimonadaceae bacterium]|nr:DUF192 domain-containing protein [Fimbriimonadaceae bacterium]